MLTASRRPSLRPVLLGGFLSLILAGPAAGQFGALGNGPGGFGGPAPGFGNAGPVFGGPAMGLGPNPGGPNVLGSGTAPTMGGGSVSPAFGMMAVGRVIMANTGGRARWDYDATARGFGGRPPGVARFGGPGRAFRSVRPSGPSRMGRPPRAAGGKNRAPIE